MNQNSAEILLLVQDLSSWLKIALSQMDTYLTWTLYNIWHRWFGLSSVNQSSLASVILHSGDGSSFSAHPLIVNCNPLIAIFFMILLHLILHTWWCHSFKASSTTHRREGSKMCISTFLLDFFSLDCSSGTPYLTCPNWTHNFLSHFSWSSFLNEYSYLTA